jgi:long-chain fatty acid transport protein
MLKSTVKLCVFVSVLFLSINAKAQMDNLANMGTKWVAANARNASLSGGDMVNYNPAGLALIENGFYASLSNQSLFRKPGHSFNTQYLGLGNVVNSYEQDGTDCFLPSVYFAYKKDKWAVSSGIFITGGGASADFPEGSVNTFLMGISYRPLINAQSHNSYQSFSNQSLKASSFYLAIPLNVSYAVSDKLALSIGGRYVSASNKTKAGMTFTKSSVGAADYAVNADYVKNATGFGGIFGIDYKANEKLNFSLHYETEVNLEFEAKDNKGNISIEANGKKTNRDLPAVLYLGASAKVLENLTIAADFNYYFQKQANWDSITDPRTGAKKSTSKVADDCYAAALGFYYQAGAKLQLMAGCKYIHFNYTDKELYYSKIMGLYESVKYDNFNVGVGAAYNITDKIQANIGISRTFWKDKTINYLLSKTVSLPVDISNKAYNIAIGLDFKF